MRRGKTLKRLLSVTLLSTLLISSTLNVNAAFGPDSPAELDDKVSFAYNGYDLNRARALRSLVPKGPVSHTSDAVMLRFLTMCLEEKSAVDPDVWNWWVNSGYDAATKYNVICSVDGMNLPFQEQNGKNVFCKWIITSPELPFEQKIAYFRSHDIRNTEDAVKDWWWQTIGSQLKVGETNQFDHENMSWYRRALYGDAHGNLQTVYVGEKMYFMDAADVEACVQNGTITRSKREGLLNGVDYWWDWKYTSNVGLNTGHMMW